MLWTLPHSQTLEMYSRLFRLNIFLFQSVNVCIVLSLVPHKVNHGGHDNTTFDIAALAASPASPKQIRWADAAFDFIQALDCKDVFLTTERECQKLIRVPKEEMNIYLADPSPYGKLQAVLPDGELKKSGVHDAVLVVDPYPEANFGHLVLLFYIEIGTTQTWCQTEGGIFLDGGECLVLGLKRRCKNALAKRRKRRNFARRCEIDFIPLVFLESDTRHKRQRLICRSSLPGFAACPQLRTINETSALFCNPIRDNTKRCETTHEKVQTSCRVFEICDQAVLVSGGWNRWSSRQYHKDNIWQFYHMLRNNGFRARNIKVFFANGMEGGIKEENDEHPHEVHPAVLKPAMRAHLQKLCQSPHCVDSLVLYMNSPASTDGTSFLWDRNQDGLASEKDKYSLSELLSDLANCQARQVHVIADQSYSGEIARLFRRSKSHKNVVVFAGSRDNQYSWGAEFTQAWTRSNHTHTCAKHVFRESKKTISRSKPQMHWGSNAVNMNIFGAPCDVVPPFTNRELRQNYLGCQNLPTALWVTKFINEGDRTMSLPANLQLDLPPRERPRTV